MASSPSSPSFLALLDSFGHHAQQQKSSHRLQPRKRRKLLAHNNNDQKTTPSSKSSHTDNDSDNGNGNGNDSTAHKNGSPAVPPCVIASPVSPPSSATATAAARYHSHHDSYRLQHLNAASHHRFAPPIRTLHPVLGRLELLRPPLLQTADFVAATSPDSAHLQTLTHHLQLYCDIVCTGFSPKDQEAFRALVCSHALEHISITRRTVLRNNEKISSSRLSESGAGVTNDFRDQGFTRPKVLFILPTRNACFELLRSISQLSPQHTLENKARFEAEFGPGISKQTFPQNKPADFTQLFNGNSDDLFRIGIKLTRRTIKLFSKFYNSDIIVASPLGLKTALQRTSSQGADYDFLSSIEVVHVDQADALLMQNWDHLDSIFVHLNRLPKESHGCDFSRIRHSYLNGEAAQYRQTIISSAYISPEINSLVSKHCKNYEGILRSISISPGQLSRHISQRFTKLQPSSPVTDPDTRLDFLTKSILPQWQSGDHISPGGLLLFVASYFDFVRLRNCLKERGQSFGAISEYSSKASVARARALFISGRHKILLYTERAHHFRRYRLRGVARVFMYSLPANPVYYAELMDMLRESIETGATDLKRAELQALFTDWDALKFERILGTELYEGLMSKPETDHVPYMLEFP